MQLDPVFGEEAGVEQEFVHRRLGKLRGRKAEGGQGLLDPALVLQRQPPADHRLGGGLGPGHRLGEGGGGGAHQFPGVEHVAELDGVGRVRGQPVQVRAGVADELKRVEGLGVGQGGAGAFEVACRPEGRGHRIVQTRVVDRRLDQRLQPGDRLPGLASGDLRLRQPDLHVQRDFGAPACVVHGTPPETVTV